MGRRKTALSGDKDAPSGPNPKPRVTLRDIAQSLGVTAMTVSRALRDQPRVSEDLRRQIQEKARELGYEPDPMLSALAHYRKSRTEPAVHAAIAWINCWREPAMLRGFKEFDAYWRGAALCAKKFGYRLEEFVVNEEMTLSRVRQILLARNIQGILLPPHGGAALTSPMNWQELQVERFSAVRFGTSIEELPLISVGCDQATAGALAFNEMSKRGYKRIGCSAFPAPRKMFGAGFLWAQNTQRTVEFRMPPLPFSWKNRKADQALLTKWLKQYRPDAVFADLPEMPQWIESAGYRVPEDIGIAATSVIDSPIDAGIDQEPEEIGRVAMLAVISLINDNARGIPSKCRQVLVEGKWVDGSSLPPRL